MKSHSFLKYFYLLTACIIFTSCQKKASDSSLVFVYDTDSAEEGGVFMTHIGQWLKDQGLSPATPTTSTGGKVTDFNGSFHGSKPFALEVTETPAPGGAVHFTGRTVWTMQGYESDIKAQQNKVAEFTNALQQITGSRKD